MSKWVIAYLLLIINGGYMAFFLYNVIFYFNIDHLLKFAVYGFIGLLMAKLSIFILDRLN